jgi:uncharacterized protein YdbL (DUF1318 family)
MYITRLAIIPLLTLPLAACMETRVVIDQAKPIDVNIHFSGNLDLVIRDARQDLEKVTGEKPVNIVRPEDLGLAPRAGSVASPLEEPALAASDVPDLFSVSLKSPHGVRGAPAERTFTVALKDDLQAKMAARNAQIRALWDSKAVGEGIDGMLSVKGALTAEQQKLVAEENADRAALYADEAATRKVPVADVAMGYYVARLGYAKKGAWYQKKNAAGSWEWVQWDR